MRPSGGATASSNSVQRCVALQSVAVSQDKGGTGVLKILALPKEAEISANSTPKAKISPPPKKKEVSTCSPKEIIYPQLANISPRKYIIIFFPKFVFGNCDFVIISTMHKNLVWHQSTHHQNYQSC